MGKSLGNHDSKEKGDIEQFFFHKLKKIVFKVIRLLSVKTYSNRSVVAGGNQYPSRQRSEIEAVFGARGSGILDC